VEQTDMGLKYNKDFCQAMEIFENGLGVDNKTITVE
jgi:hypothetical protein